MDTITPLSNREKDKIRMVQLAQADDEAWFKNHVWFENNYFEYILHESGQSFIMYFDDVKRVKRYVEIAFCFTNPAYRNRGMFTDNLRILQAYARQTNAAIEAQSRSYNEHNWVKRGFKKIEEVDMYNNVRVRWCPSPWWCPSP